MMCCLSFSNVQAQEKQGIYLTGKDYNEGTIIPEDGQCKVKNRQLLHQKYIDLILDGKRYRYHKDSIFGYRSGQLTYRLYQKEKYQIVEHGRIIIYSVYKPEYGVKNFVQVPHLYFSTDATSLIAPLSVLNIKKAFPEDFTLHHYLDIIFDQTNIAAYDSMHQMYSINYLLTHSHNNNTTK